MDKYDVIIAKYPRFHLHTNGQPKLLEGRIVSRDSEFVFVQVDGKETIAFKVGEHSAKSLTHVYKMFRSVYEFNNFTDNYNLACHELDKTKSILTMFDTESLSKYIGEVAGLNECYCK